MSLRSQLIVAFLLLAIVPLAGVVGYTYWSNAGVLRDALETEAGELTERLERNMKVASADLKRGLVGLDHRMGAEGMVFEAASIQGVIAEAMEAMGPVADSIAAWRFGGLPQAPAAPVPPAAGVIEEGARVEGTKVGGPRAMGTRAKGTLAPTVTSPPRAPATGGLRGSPPALESVASAERQLGRSDATIARRQMEELDRRAEERARLRKMVFSVERDRDRSRGDIAGENRRTVWKVRPLPGGSAAKTGEVIASRFEELTAELEEKGEAMGRAAESGDIETLVKLSLKAADMNFRRMRLKRLLGERWPEGIDDMALVPDVDIRGFITGVLESTERKQGEIPFAADSDGNLYTVTPEDFDQLVALVDDQEDLQTDVEEPVLLHQGGWLIARQLDPESELTFGIARPYADSFQEIRARTGHNLLLGFGMIGFSLLGILPLSSRLTRRITSLSTEAERLAGGDLEARVPVQGRDELGQLAQTFNRMASRLQTNQRQMLDQELESQRHEAARTLLESENRRRGEELEAARKFQLSMLPEKLPDVAEFEVAVYHQTATEVGGDYYDFAVRDDAMTIALGDATGHGARAATLVTVIRTLFLNTGASTPLARFLNEAVVPLRSMSLDRMAMSLMLVRLQRSENRLKLASAGMPPAYRLRASGVVEELACHAVPLGALAKVEYREIEHDFEAGDTMVLLSDGLPEQADANGDPIGYERLAELLRDAVGNSPAEIVEILRQRLEVGTCGGPPSDDVTLVAVRRR